MTSVSPAPRPIMLSCDPGSVIDHPSGCLALSPRNERFTAAGIPGFVAYRERGRHRIVLGGVHASVAHQQDLLDRFLAFSEMGGRRVLVVQLRAPQAPLFLGRGFTVNQLGTNFGLTLRGFTLGGSKKMQLRNKISRARRAGLRVVEVGRELPRDVATLTALHAISSAWLEGKGEKELDFMVGEIGQPDEAWRRIFVALDPHDRPAGFITYVPAWGSAPGYLHDLTRRLPGASPGVMELCHARALEQMVAEGVPCVHFGLTPFVVDDSELPGASRWAALAVRTLYRYGSALYPAASQAQYKLKWGPDIVEREYIAARPLSIRAVLDLLRLTKVV
jgi:lysylphosphatidylglycerol synthetase-like protein (DUF2156 family)